MAARLDLPPVADDEYCFRASVGCTKTFLPAIIFLSLFSSFYGFDRRYHRACSYALNTLFTYAFLTFPNYTDYKIFLLPSPLLPKPQSFSSFTAFFQLCRYVALVGAVRRDCEPIPNGAL